MPPRQRQVYLLSISPDEGFYWRTNEGRVFLSNKDCNTIVGALKTSTARPIDSDYVQDAWAELFIVAGRHVDDMKTMEPARFWAAVVAETPWAANKHNLSGEVAHGLSKHIVAARHRCKEHAHFWCLQRDLDFTKENLNSAETEDHQNFIMGNTTLTRAVDEFHDAFYEKYRETEDPQMQDIAETYFPLFTYDSCNEGSYEATANHRAIRDEKMKDLRKKKMDRKEQAKGGNDDGTGDEVMRDADEDEGEGTGGHQFDLPMHMGRR
ncbi:hypothetical protein F5Y18DRAFT_444827 [Xylariaceae sp. FL1019]|nr:hypothetical protein F5Y18DRAFT_444827 [Xylariaceae sp. FL1019]